MEVKAALILINQGTPQALTVPSIRQYCRELLSDRRIVDIPPWLWKPILYAGILPFRPPQLLKAFKRIWISHGGAPLRFYSERLTNAVAEQLPGVTVRLAMRYGSPSIPEVLEGLLQGNHTHLTVIPLFPQAAAATTGSVWDAVSHYLSKGRQLPHLRFISEYATNPNYIHALAETIGDSFDSHGVPDALLCSYHGLPERYITEGEAYTTHVNATTSALQTALQLPKTVHFSLSYQSRVGPGRWLQPETTQVVRQLARNGVRHLQLCCPGFAVDCLETLDEMAIRCKKVFLDAGGKRFHYISALNDSCLHASVFTQVFHSTLL